MLLSLILSFLNKNKGVEGEKCIVLVIRKWENLLKHKFEFAQASVSKQG